MLRTIIIITVGIIAAILMRMIMQRVYKTVDKIAKPKVQKSELIACAKCGSYTPTNSAIQSDDKYFCSQNCVGK